MKKVSVKNTKGLNLSGVIEIPANNDRTYPGVLLFHGFKGYKEEAYYTKLAKKLLQKNIISVRFDASGFGDSEGDFQKEYRLSNYTKDAECVYKWFTEQPFIDKSRIGIVGHSMGGLQVLILGAKHPEIRALVSVSPPDVFATGDDFGKKAGLWKKQGYLEIESSRVKGLLRVPYEYLLDARKYDGRKYAFKIKYPKLFILGLNDTTVIPKQTRAVFDAASNPKELIEIPGMDHFYKKHPKYLLAVNKKIVSFLEKYLVV